MTEEEWKAFEKHAQGCVDAMPAFLELKECREDEEWLTKNSISLSYETYNAFWQLEYFDEEATDRTSHGPTIHAAITAARGK